MPDFLLELFSEEIPARMQVAAAKDIERLVVGGLSDRGLLFEGAKSFSGLRRLTLAIAGLPAKQPDTREERKGPRVGAPGKALEGFLRSAGVTLDQCSKQSDAKGEFYVAVIAREGRETAEVLAEIVPEAMAKLPWPKSMRWTAGTTRWVRPLHGILATFDGEVVPFEFANIKSGNTTLGHRFLSHGPIAVRRFEDYEKKLRDAHVILDPAERRDIILHEVKQKAFALGLEPVEDEALLDEVAGLVEWPVVLIGRIEDDFMDLPPEILRTSMRTHQKYFALRTPGKEGLANRFAVVSNMVASDGGKEIVTGNERVLRARLSDAKFFWDQDRKRTLESRLEDLKHVVFYAARGSIFDRTVRISFMARFIAHLLEFDGKKAARAAMLCKSDLVSGIVGEFPEMQGVMGRHLALNEGLDPEICDAILDHYKPQGAYDKTPTKPISICVALADKLDTLTTLWAAGERPSGSKDPYGLRRNGLGIVRILLGNDLRLELFIPMLLSLVLGRPHMRDAQLQRILSAIDLERTGLDELGALPEIRATIESALEAKNAGSSPAAATDEDHEIVSELLSFLADRLKVGLKEMGTRHDLIDAVFALGTQYDLVELVRRVEALQSFLKTEDGASLLIAYRRAANILKAEERRDSTTFGNEPNLNLFNLPEEMALFEALARARVAIATNIAAERFVEAMGVMAKLRPPVDAFFDKVIVNAPEPELRRNRLLLLSRLRATLHLVADFSKIEG